MLFYRKKLYLLICNHLSERRKIGIQRSQQCSFNYLAFLEETWLPFKSDSKYLLQNDVRPLYLFRRDYGIRIQCNDVISCLVFLVARIVNYTEGDVLKKKQELQKDGGGPANIL